MYSPLHSRLTTVTLLITLHGDLRENTFALCTNQYQCRSCLRRRKHNVASSVYMFEKLKRERTASLLQSHTHLNPSVSVSDSERARIHTHTHARARGHTPRRKTRFLSGSAFSLHAPVISHVTGHQSRASDGALAPAQADLQTLAGNAITQSLAEQRSQCGEEKQADTQKHALRCASCHTAINT